MPETRGATPAGLEILDAVHPIYAANKDGWLREERRLHGGDAVLIEAEFPRFLGETDTSYALRKARATYLNFPKIHATTIAGQLRKGGPTPGKGLSFGAMGEIRSRESIDTPTLAELIRYNIDGIGNDGTQWEAWTDGVQERACVTGFRWTMVEMPTDPRREPAAGEPDATATERALTEADVLAGLRPYAVEFPPPDVPYWETSLGRLDVAVIRVPVGRSGTRESGNWEPAPTELGYYLLVRKGYRGLGDTYAAGGWWLFDQDKALQSSGTWEKTLGQIPLFTLITDDSKGTSALPSIARSLTMELGQLGVSLMNAVSERNHNARQAAKSVIFILGADEKTHNVAVGQAADGSIMISVPPVLADDGKGGKVMVVPQIYNSATGAVETGVYQTIIDSTIAEAKEIMVRQLTAGADASGKAREAAFGEATEPLLVKLARRRETYENNLLYFFALRSGKSPQGAVTEWPREFELEPVIDQIDRTLERMRVSGVRSPTWTAHLLEQSGAEDQTLPSDPAVLAIVQKELAESAKEAVTRSAQMATLAADFGAEP